MRYAYAIAVSADSLKEIQKLSNRATHTSEKYRLELNIKKTNYMVLIKSPDQHYVLYCINKAIEKLRSFTYLGGNIKDLCLFPVEISARPSSM